MGTLIVLAAIFLTPLVIGTLCGNGWVFLQLTLMSLLIWPMWFLVAFAACDELQAHFR